MSKRAMDELHETCDKACKILEKTKDGDMLDPRDLKLTELAVNGHLTAAGREVFEELYQRVVVDGNYIKPYLHDIEHITRDHEGYIYYKGIHVEHYDRDYVYSEDAKNSLLELKRRCEFLEHKGIEVSCGNVVWNWETYADEYGAERLKELDTLIGGFRFPYSRVEIYNSGREFTYFACGEVKDLEKIKNHPITQSMIGRYFDNEYEIKVEGFIYGSNNRVEPSMRYLLDTVRGEIESLLKSCHGYLAKHGALEKLPAVKYKTDFAENYEKTKELDALLNSPGRGFAYSVVDVWGDGNYLGKFFTYGTPTLDEIKKHEDYKWMNEAHGAEAVSATTFIYGSGEPLPKEQLPPITEMEKLLSEVHDYLADSGLSQETRRENYNKDVVVNRRVNHSESEYDYDAEDGCEL